MNLEKVVFGFFILLAATLNFGFVWGDIDVAAHHDVYELFGALVVSLIATLSSSGTARRSARCTWPPAWWPTCSSPPPPSYESTPARPWPE